MRGRQCRACCGGNFKTAIWTEEWQTAAWREAAGAALPDWHGSRKRKPVGFPARQACVCARCRFPLLVPFPTRAIHFGKGAARKTVDEKQPLARRAGWVQKTLFPLPASGLFRECCPRNVAAETRVEGLRVWPAQIGGLLCARCSAYARMFPVGMGRVATGR